MIFQIDKTFEMAIKLLLQSTHIEMKNYRSVYIAARHF